MLSESEGKRRKVGVWGDFRFQRLCRVSQRKCLVWKCGWRGETRWVIYEETVVEVAAETLKAKVYN